MKKQQVFPISSRKKNFKQIFLFSTHSKTIEKSWILRTYAIDSKLDEFHRFPNPTKHVTQRKSESVLVKPLHHTA